MALPSDVPDLNRHQPRVITGVGGQTFTCGYLDWGMLVKFAYECGWRPLGTVPPAGWHEKLNPDDSAAKWYKNNYFSRLGQQVTAPDALNMAIALEHFLPDIPEHDALGHKVASQIEGAGMGRLRMIMPGAKVNSFEYFSGNNRAKVIAFIELCKLGGFSIG
jgi:hypothetical protein